MAIEAPAAAAVTLGQVKPRARAGASAAAKVPKANVPSSAIRSPYSQANSAATAATPTTAERPHSSSSRTGRPSARGRSRTRAAAPILTNESAVDITAARTAANAIPATTPGADCTRNCGVAESTRSSGAIVPRPTSAGTARPMPSQTSTHTAWLAPRITGIQRSLPGSRSM